MNQSARQDRSDELLMESIEDAISDVRTIEAMEGEFSPIEYRHMAQLESAGDAIAFCDYRKQCRRSLLQSWFTTAEQVDNYVFSNNPRKNILGGVTP